MALDILSRKEVMKRLGVTDYQMRESTKTGFLEGIKAPVGVFTKGRWLYTADQITVYEENRSEFRKIWFSKERLIERLGLKRESYLNHALYKTGHLYGVPVPKQTSLNHTKRVYFHVEEIQRYERELNIQMNRI